MALTDYVIMPGADYQALCDKVREKTGSTEKLTSGALLTQLDNMGGGSDERQITCKFGNFTAVGGTGEVVEHNLGYIPDFIVVVGAGNLTLKTANTIVVTGGCSAAFRAAGGTVPLIFNNTNNSMFSTAIPYCAETNTSGYGEDWDSMYGDNWGAMRDLTATSFKFGGTGATTTAGDSYTWFALTGLFE